MFTRSLRGCAALALVAGIAVAVTPTTARAGVTVDFTTAGVFGSNNSNTVTLGGITVTYNARASNPINVPPPTNVDFGTFSVSGTTPSSGTFSDTFTLTINQTLPLNGNVSFPPATVTGLIEVDSGGAGSSQAYVQFDDTQLTQSIGLISYSIVSADGPDPNTHTPGRVNLAAPGNMSSIQGSVTATPEPATLALAFSALPLLGLGAWRRRKARG